VSQSLLHQVKYSSSRRLSGRPGTGSQVSIPSSSGQVFIPNTPVLRDLKREFPVSIPSSSGQVFIPLRSLSVRRLPHSRSQSLLHQVKYSSRRLATTWWGGVEGSQSLLHQVKYSSLRTARASRAHRARGVSIPSSSGQVFIRYTLPRQGVYARCVSIPSSSGQVFIREDKKGESCGDF